MSQDNILRSVPFPGLNTQSQYDPGVCYVCGHWSAMRRRVCIHEGLDMLICWVCGTCEIVPVRSGQNNAAPEHTNRRRRRQKTTD